MTDHSHVVHNGKREMTIDELAATQPGMDRLMAEVGPRMPSSPPEDLDLTAGMSDSDA